MLDESQIKVIAERHGVTGDVVKLVREVEHLTVAEIVSLAALSFVDPSSVMSEATKAVGHLVSRRP